MPPARSDPQRAETGLSHWGQHRRCTGGSALSTHQGDGAAEAFRGFINLFGDHLAPQLMQELTIPVDLIWGEMDPGSHSGGRTLEQHYPVRALADGDSWGRALSP